MYRFERKYYLPDADYGIIRKRVLTHAAVFTKLHHERVVNNIYFDTPGFDYFYDNIEGVSERKKIRLRWYGQTFNLQEKLALEYKTKTGLIGKKDSFLLQNINTDDNFSVARLRNEIKNNELPFHIKHELLNLYPVLLNKYTREYFTAEDKSFRITLDRDMMYYRINHHGKFISPVKKYSDVVLEIKYDPEYELTANKITHMFPFRVTKSSKYVMGIQNILDLP